MLTITSDDYRNVEIKENSVVYCDIPYKGTSEYLNKFNHNEFYDWASSRDFPVYVSEYNIDDPRFEEVYLIEKMGLLSGSSNRNTKLEKLYWNRV